MRHLIGQRVRLHVNLQNGSIAVSEKTASGWRVAGYTCGATLSNATPRRAGDGAKVWATRIGKGRRAVVAWVEGTLTALDVTHPRWWTDAKHPLQSAPLSRLHKARWLDPTHGYSLWNFHRNRWPMWLRTKRQGAMICTANSIQS